MGRYGQTLPHGLVARHGHQRLRLRQAALPAEEKAQEAEGPLEYWWVDLFGEFRSAGEHGGGEEEVRGDGGEVG